MMIDPPLPILLICTVALSFAVALVISLVTLSILLGVERLEEVYKELRTGVHRQKKEA